MAMTFKELKRWASEHGYDVLKAKGTEECVWTKIDDPLASGISDTLKDTATQIYNHMTDNKWLEYQQEYKKFKTENIKFSI